MKNSSFVYPFHAQMLSYARTTVVISQYEAANFELKRKTPIAYVGYKITTP